MIDFPFRNLFAYNSFQRKAVLRWIIAKVEDDGTDTRIAAQTVDQYPTYSNRLVGNHIEIRFDSGRRQCCFTKLRGTVLADRNPQFAVRY